jgi:hypothetical protein
VLPKGSNATVQARPKPVLSIPVKLLHIFSKGLEELSGWQQGWSPPPINF